MTNKEKTRNLELLLKRKKKTRKLLRWIFLLISIIAIVTFCVLLNSTKEVVKYIDTIEVTEYDVTYILCIVYSSLSTIVAIIFLVVEYLLCNFGTAESNDQYITVFKTISQNTVYINGEFNVKLYSISIKLFHKIKLPNDVCVTITFLPFPFRLARFSFDDNTPSIEL